uniref:Uncharacterized protein n=1 Tax=Arion vulgaris TaxID=1028688 RepID=A0A0B7AGJ0_9EUPU
MASWGGQPQMKTRKTLGSTCRRRDADHITLRVPMVIEKYEPNTVFPNLRHGIKKSSFTF